MFLSLDILDDDQSMTLPALLKASDISILIDVRGANAGPMATVIRVSSFTDPVRATATKSEIEAALVYMHTSRDVIVAVPLLTSDASA